MDDVPIQYFQSVIAIELAVTGALLFQIRYFTLGRGSQEDERLPDALLRLALAVVLAATLFGSLAAMLHGGGRIEAAVVLIGLAVSLLPILLRVLPPLQREAEPTNDIPTSPWLACSHTPSLSLVRWCSWRHDSEVRPVESVQPAELRRPLPVSSLCVALRRRTDRDSPRLLEPKGGSTHSVRGPEGTLFKLP